jgi:uncharacterized protein YqhQ
MLKSASRAPKQVGGQAVIEGVMMRAPGGVAVCVRKRNGSINTWSFPYISHSQRRKILGLPIIRGAVTLIEMLVLGIEALNWSAQEAADDEQGQSTKDRGQSTKYKGQKMRERVGIVMTLGVALVLGVLFFVYLPLFLTGLLVGQENQVLFNLVDGLIRVIFFLAYVYFIQFIPDIKRVFQYHGAEHKAIFCYESGRDLSVDAASGYSTRHPRCGTSFLLIVFVFAIVIFAVADSLLFGLKDVTPHKLTRFVFHLALLPIVAGVSYELTKWSSKRSENRLIHFLLAPGLALQRITTKEPDASQVEVGIVSLNEALRFNMGEGDASRP